MLPASTALAKTIIVRPRMTFSIGWADFPPQGLDQTLARFCKVSTNVAMNLRWGWQSVATIKFAFS
jgi:hypothetical protein